MPDLRKPARAFGLIEPSQQPVSVIVLQRSWPSLRLRLGYLYAAMMQVACPAAAKHRKLWRGGLDGLGKHGPTPRHGYAILSTVGGGCGALRRHNGMDRHSQSSCRPLGSWRAQIGTSFRFCQTTGFFQLGLLIRPTAGHSCVTCAMRPPAWLGEHRSIREFPRTKSSGRNRPGRSRPRRAGIPPTG